MIRYVAILSQFPTLQPPSTIQQKNPCTKWTQATINVPPSPLTPFPPKKKREIPNTKEESCVKLFGSKDPVYYLRPRSPFPPPPPWFWNIGYPVLIVTACFCGCLLPMFISSVSFWMLMDRLWVTKSIEVGIFLPRLELCPTITIFGN